MLLPPRSGCVLTAGHALVDWVWVCLADCEFGLDICRDLMPVGDWFLDLMFAL